MSFRDDLQKILGIKKEQPKLDKGKPVRGGNGVATTAVPVEEPEPPPCTPQSEILRFDANAQPSIMTARVIDGLYDANTGRQVRIILDDTVHFCEDVRIVNYPPPFTGETNPAAYFKISIAEHFNAYLQDFSGSENLPREESDNTDAYGVQFISNITSLPADLAENNGNTSFYVKNDFIEGSMASLNMFRNITNLPNNFDEYYSHFLNSVSALNPNFIIQSLKEVRDYLNENIPSPYGSNSPYKNRLDDRVYITIINQPPAYYVRDKQSNSRPTNAKARRKVKEWITSYPDDGDYTYRYSNGESLAKRVILSCDATENENIQIPANKVYYLDHYGLGSSVTGKDTQFKFESRFLVADELAFHAGLMYQIIANGVHESDNALSIDNPENCLITPENSNQIYTYTDIYRIIPVSENAGGNYIFGESPLHCEAKPENVASYTDYGLLEPKGKMEIHRLKIYPDIFILCLRAKSQNNSWAFYAEHTNNDDLIMPDYVKVSEMGIKTSNLDNLMLVDYQGHIFNIYPSGGSYWDIDVYDQSTQQLITSYSVNSSSGFILSDN